MLKKIMRLLVLPGSEWLENLPHPGLMPPKHEVLNNISRSRLP